MTQSSSGPKPSPDLDLPSYLESSEAAAADGSQPQTELNGAQTHQPQIEPSAESPEFQDADTPSDTAQILKDRKRALLQRQPRQPKFSFSTKVIVCAATLSALPLIVFGSILYWQPFKDRTAVTTPAEIQQTQQNLGLSAGFLAIAAGVTASVLARRATRPIVRAASTSNFLVNHLRKEASSAPADQDELTALESNLQVLRQQIPGLLSTQESDADWLKTSMVVGHRLRESQSKEDVLRTAATEVRQRYRADRVAILQLKENNEGIFVEESSNQGWPKLLWSTIQDSCFSDDERRQYLKGRVQAVDDIYTAELSECYLKMLERFSVRANIVAPILCEDQLFGLLIVHQCSGPRFWKMAEVDLLTQIAEQVGTALDRVKLLDESDQRATQSQLFIDIARQIRTSLNLDEVLKTTVTAVRKALSTDRVIVYSFDEDWYGTVVAEAVVPGYPKALWAKIKDPCFAEGYIDHYQGGRVQATENVHEAGLTECHLGQLEPFGVKANLVAPILKDNRLFGLLIAHQCSAPRRWQAIEVDWFAQIATQVGFAIDHALLLEQVIQESVQSRTLTDITRQIRASLVEDNVLKTTVTETRRTIQADRVIVYSFDEDWCGTVVAESVLPGYPKALWAKIKDPCFAEGYVDQYRDGRVQATTNVETTGLTQCHLNQLEPYGVRANLVAPILKDDKLFGLLIAHQCAGPRQWQPAEIELFTQIAVQVGFALDHARLLDQVDQAYQSATFTSGEQQHQREQLQQNLRAWLQQNTGAVKTLSADILQQMKNITAVYHHLKTYAAETQSALTALAEQENQGHQTQQALQKTYTLAEALQQSIAATQAGLGFASEQVQQANSPAQKLAEITQGLHQMTSQLKLQAMNAALEATRSEDSAQEFAGIGEKVLELTRQIETQITELTTLTNMLQSQLKVATATLSSEVRQVQVGMKLGDEAEQTFMHMVEVNAQFQSWLQSLIQSGQRQSEASTAANQLILEAAARVNQASEQAAVIATSFEQLGFLANEETTA